MSKSPSLRRIQADIRELALDPSDRYYASPLEHDMFEWHFTIRGAEDTDFNGGIYHGRILVRTMCFSSEDMASREFQISWLLSMFNASALLFLDTHHRFPFPLHSHCFYFATFNSCHQNIHLNHHT